MGILAFSAVSVYSQEVNSPEENPQEVNPLDVDSQEEIDPRDESTLFFNNQDTEDDGAVPATPTVQNAISGGIFQMIIALVIVLGIIYIVYIIVKKASGQKFVPSELFKLKGSFSLSPGKNLHLIEVGNQIFLLGTGENTVNLISEITDKETHDQIKLTEVSGKVNLNFSNLISKTLGKTKASNTPDSEPQQEETTIGGTEFILSQKDRLRRLQGDNNE